MNIPLKVIGMVKAIRGSYIEAELVGVAIDDCCRVIRRNGETLLARVIATNGARCKLAALGGTESIQPGCRVFSSRSNLQINTRQLLPGRIIAVRELLCANPETPLLPLLQKKVFDSSPAPTERSTDSRRLTTDLLALDLLCPVGRGQRLAIVAPAATGKTSLLLQLASSSLADINVFALVGERGREVSKLLSALPESVRGKSIIVYATGDHSSTERALTPFVATAIAELFRDASKDVALYVDSLTRTARAIREVGLAAGELPVRHGFPISVYEQLPKLVERAGATTTGSITAFYTVLQDGIREFDALTEEISSLLDGEIVLSAEYARERIYPAIDHLNSISRFQQELLAESEKDLARSTVAMIASLKQELSEFSALYTTPKAKPELKKALHNLLRLLRTKQKTTANLHSEIQLLRKLFNQYNCGIS